jgi:hypothetical protein
MRTPRGGAKPPAVDGRAMAPVQPRVPPDVRDATEPRRASAPRRCRTDVDLGAKGPACEALPEPRPWRKARRQRLIVAGQERRPALTLRQVPRAAGGAVPAKRGIQARARQSASSIAANHPVEQKFSAPTAGFSIIAGPATSSTLPLGSIAAVMQKWGTNAVTTCGVHFTDDRRR